MPRDKSYLATDYDDPNLNMVGPMTNGFLPTYWDFWKYDFDFSNQSRNSNVKYKRKEKQLYLQQYTKSEDAFRNYIETVF